MSMLWANVVCVLLVGVELVARTWRIQWLLRGTGHHITFVDGLVLNAAGDVGAAVTPNRIGAEPPRVGGMLLSGVPASAAIVAIAVEAAAMWPVNIVIALGLALAYAPAWWRTAGPALEDTFADWWRWALGVACVGVLAWLAVRRFAPALVHTFRSGARAAWDMVRKMPAWTIAMAMVMTALSVCARVAILPVLALTLPHPPPLGPTCFASFVLIFAQNVLPLPSGAGVVELGFLGGAAGNLGAGYKTLLLLWRFYSTIVLVIAGIGLATWRYGPHAIRALVKGKDEDEPQRVDT